MKNNARVNLKINEPVGGKRDAGDGSDAVSRVDAAIEELKN